MFNLLPEIEKKNIRTIYNDRRMVLSLLLLTITGVIAFLLIIPSFIMTKAKEAETVSQVGLLREALASKDVDDLNNAITVARDEIKALQETNGSTLSVHDLFLKVLSHKSANIRVTGLLYGTVGEKHEIVVNGIARDRESLLTFAQEIGKEQVFSDISLPVSNFAKNKDIEFSFSVTGDF
ncbi:MAG: hypothetical protein U1D31_02645 [Patescibacteria group bacterium]|nr:hypothetical protein [bacterium]MDZ4240994.1 hypothetical protein [Patescibacteria group bacterium]